MLRRAICAGVVALLAPISAHADDPPDGCGPLRQRLTREHDRAARWTLGWGLGLGGLAVAQGVAAPFVDDRVQRDTLYVGAVNAAIGAASSLVFPLRIDATPDGASCAEVEQAVIAGGTIERSAFYLDHLGGFAVNVGAAVVLAYYTDVKTAALSFAAGYAIALVRTYTSPRWAWHPTIMVAPASTVGAGVAATF